LMATLGHNKRWWILGPLLVGSALLALFGDKTPVDGAVVAVASRAPVASSGHSAAGLTAPAPQPEARVLVPREQLVTSGQRAPVRDLFSQHSWTPPSPKIKPMVLPEPVPTAPPLPFAYLGKKLEGGAWEVYLGQGEKTFVVREGQVLEGQYRVESIKPPQMGLMYLPLGQAQNLSIGETR
jgi:hypothetical protein